MTQFGFRRLPVRNSPIRSGPSRGDCPLPSLVKEFLVIDLFRLDKIILIYGDSLESLVLSDLNYSRKLYIFCIKGLCWRLSNDYSKRGLLSSVSQKSIYDIMISWSRGRLYPRYSMNPFLIISSGENRNPHGRFWSSPTHFDIYHTLGYIYI